MALFVWLKRGGVVTPPGGTVVCKCAHCLHFVVLCCVTIVTSGVVYYHTADSITNLSSGNTSYSLAPSLPLHALGKLSQLRLPTYSWESA